MRCLKYHVDSSIRDDSLSSLLIRVVVLVFILSLGNHKVHGDKSRHTGSVLPEIRNTRSNFTYSEGDLAVIRCSITNLGARKVIWRKASHPNPLTVGEMTFVPDDRFQVHHIEDTGQWNLFIKDIKHSDAGIYECQVSSKEKYIRKLFLVNVIDKIHGERDIQMSGTQEVEEGESILLSCNATGGSTAPHSLDWLKDGRKLVTDRSRRVNITIHISYVSMTISSNLTVSNAHSADEGTYLCRTSDALIKNMTVTVTDGGSDNVKRTVDHNSQPSRNSAAASRRNSMCFVISLCAHETFVIYTIFIVLTFHHFIN